MGTTIVIDDFKMVWREKKRGFLIGLLSQYGFMPLISYAFCFAFGFSNTAAIGVMLCGMMPGGSTSNLFTYGGSTEGEKRRGGGEEQHAVWCVVCGVWCAVCFVLCAVSCMVCGTAC